MLAKCGARLFCARTARDHQPPNQIPTPWTSPTGQNAAAAISSGRAPLAAQTTIEASQAA